MNSEIEKVENYDLDKKREFLKEVVKDISVQYNPKSKSHIFDVHFLLPIVGDSLLYGNCKDKKGFKTYEIKDGRSKVNKTVEVVTTKTTPMDSKHIKLTNRIQHLKEVEGKSNNEISDILNSEGLTPVNGGKWYKSRLSSFYNYSKNTHPKVVRGKKIHPTGSFHYGGIGLCGTDYPRLPIFYLDFRSQTLPERSCQFLHITNSLFCFGALYATTMIFRFGIIAN